MDQSLFFFIFGFSRKIPLLDGAAVFFAEYAPYLFGIGFFLLLFSMRRDWRWRVFVFCEAALAAILARGIATEILRFIIPIQRPAQALGIEALISENSASFPSGHAAFLFALGMAVWYANKKWGYWYLAFALINGIARIFSGVHWPSDILAGVLVGIGSAVFIHALLKKERQAIVQ